MWDMLVSDYAVNCLGRNLHQVDLTLSERPKFLTHAEYDAEFGEGTYSFT